MAFEYNAEESKKKLRKALNFAKSNPNHPDSQELRRRMEAGQFNFELRNMGLPEVPIERKKLEMPKMEEQEQLQTIMPEPKENEFSKFGERLGETVRERKSDQARIAARGEAGEISAGKELFQRGGQAIGGAFELAGEAALGLAEIAAPKWLEDKVKSAVQATGEEVVDYTKKFMQDLREGNANEQEIASRIDEAISLYQTDETFRDDVRAAGGILEALATVTGAGPAKQALKESVDTTIDVAKRTAPVVREGVEKVADVGQDITEAGIKKVGEVTEQIKANRLVAQEKKVDEAIGRIIQGEPDDIAGAKKALSEVDTTGVKTYNELNNRLDENVATLAEKVDAELDKYPEKYTPDKTGTYTKVGEETVVDTPILDALDGLENAYLKSGESAKAVAIKQLRSRFQNEGLNVKEMNNLAREYGKEFKDRAFTKLGDPKPGFNAENFENTRKGIKQVVRDRIPGEEGKILDEKMSDLYNTKLLTEKMEVKVNNLYQKVKKRGLLEKMARGLADVVNIATFNTLSGFLSRMLPSNVGLKTMNALDIQEELVKNLKTIDKLLKSDASDKEIIQGISEMITKQSRITE